MFQEDKAKIQCFIDLSILDVLLIDDNENFFKPKFHISIKWQLKFQHLKRGMEKLLLEKEIEQLWIPQIMLDDINQYNR